MTQPFVVQVCGKPCLCSTQVHSNNTLVYFSLQVVSAKQWKTISRKLTINFDDLEEAPDNINSANETTTTTPTPACTSPQVGHTRRSLDLNPISKTPTPTDGIPKLSDIDEQNHHTITPHQEASHKVSDSKD